VKVKREKVESEKWRVKSESEKGKSGK